MKNFEAPFVGLALLSTLVAGCESGVEPAAPAPQERSQCQDGGLIKKLILTSGSHEVVAIANGDCVPVKELKDNESLQTIGEISVGTKIREICIAGWATDESDGVVTLKIATKSLEGFTVADPDVDTPKELPLCSSDDDKNL